MEEAADKIAFYYGSSGGSPEKNRATGLSFAKLLQKVAHALKDVEWDMSDDSDDLTNVEKLIGPKERAKDIAEDLRSAIAFAQTTLKELEK